MTAPIPNLFKVPELKEKLLFTLLCLVIYRIGAHIATPGVNVEALADFMSTRGTGTQIASGRSPGARRNGGVGVARHLPTAYGAG